MWFLVLVACRPYELLAAEVDVQIEPIDGDVGAFVDTTLPMRLEAYGPELDEGLQLRPYFGYVARAPIDAEVACFEDVLLDLSTSNDQLALFFFGTSEGGGPAVGVNFLEGGRSGRRWGRAEDQLDFSFPCLDDPIPHRVTLEWVVDRSAPVPYINTP